MSTLTLPLNLPVNWKSFKADVCEVSNGVAVFSACNLNSIEGLTCNSPKLPNEISKKSLIPADNAILRSLMVELTLMSSKDRSSFTSRFSFASNDKFILSFCVISPKSSVAELNELSNELARLTNCPPEFDNKSLSEVEISLNVCAGLIPFASNLKLPMTTKLSFSTSTTRSKSNSFCAKDKMSELYSSIPE